MPETITSLIEKLEGAEMGCAELSTRVIAALLAPADAWVEQSRFNGAWCVYECREKPRLWDVGGDLRGVSVTNSLDAALALASRVLTMGAWDVGYTYNSDRPHYARLVIVRDDEGQPEIYGRSATPALALCAAILRAQSEARV